MDIVHVVEIEASPDALYAALTTESGLQGWWTPNAKAGPEVGAVNEFRFQGGMEFKLRVDRLDAGKRVDWSPVEGPPDWTGTRIRFEITPAPEGSMLRFTHAGFASTEGGFGIYSYAWAKFIRSLKLLCETGRGEPHGT